MARFAGIPVEAAAPVKPRFSGVPVDQPAAPVSAAAPVQSALATIQVPETDPMGMPTGNMIDVPAPQMSYGDQMANVGRVIDNGVRLGVNGALFGLPDKFAGGMDALTGQADSYDAGVKAQRARTQDLRDAAPIAAGATEIAGGLLGGVGLAKTGLTLAGKAGTALLPRIMAFGAEGAAYGGAHGAGNAYSDKVGDYLSAAWDGAKTGGLVGGGLPVMGSIASALFRGARSVAGPSVDGAGRLASALLRSATVADEAGVRGVASMGPEAMLVDAGPSMLGLGQGAGTGTGPGKSALVDALRSRDAGTGQRLAGVLDETLGPAPVPSQIKAGLDESKARIGEQYGRLPFDGIADAGDLAESLDEVVRLTRGPAQAAVKRVRSYLDDIPDPSVPVPKPAPGEPKPGPKITKDPRVLFETRQAIDDLLSTEVAPKAIRQLVMARQSVDEMLDIAVPGIKQVDGRFQEVARQGEALDRGATLFDKGKTATRPTELEKELQTAALPQGQMVGPSGAPYRMRQGARAEVDRLVGTNINDLNTLERTLATPQDWNAQKFAAIFGQPEYETVAQALGSNRRMRQSYQDIVQGSQTAQRIAAQKAMDGEVNVPLDTTATGIAAKGVSSIWKALVGLSNEATKDDIGRILANKGPDAVRIMEALLANAQATQAGSRAVGRSIANPAYLAGAGQTGGRRESR